MCPSFPTKCQVYNLKRWSVISLPLMYTMEIAKTEQCGYCYKAEVASLFHYCQLNITMHKKYYWSATLGG